MPPMEDIRSIGLGALQRPAMPKKLDSSALVKSGSNQHANSILQDLKAVEESRKVNKKLKKSETLIYKVSHTLRRDCSDHLLTTSAIWALISLLRLDGGIHADSQKRVMVDAGIPGIIYDVLKTERLTGSTKQYASELAFFLCSDTPYPVSKTTNKAGPISSFPEVHMADRLSNSDLKDDALSLAHSDVSSLSGYNQGSSTFIPYRISDNNIAKFNQIFTFNEDTAAMRENKINRMNNALAATKQSPFELNKKILNNLGFIDEDKSTLASTEDLMSLGLSSDDDNSSIASSSHVSHDESYNNASINYKLHMLQTRSPFFEAGGDNTSQFGPGTVNTQLITTGSRTIAEMNYNLNRTKMYSKELNPHFVQGRQLELSRSGTGTSALNQFKETEVFKLGTLSATSTNGQMAGTYNQITDTRNMNMNMNMNTNVSSSSPFPSGPMMSRNINDRVAGVMGMTIGSAGANTRPQKGTSAWNDYNYDGGSTGTGANTAALRSQSQSTMIRPILTMNAVSGGSSLRPGTVTGSGDSRSRSPPKSPGFGNKTTGYFDPNRSILTGGSSITSGNMWDLSMTNSKYKEAPREVDIPGMYAGIDPLSLNVSAGFTRIKVNSKLMDPDRDDEEELEDNGFSASNDSDYESGSSLEGSQSGSEDGSPGRKKRENPYLRRQKLRYRAEKIVDYSFMKRLFIKKATVQDAQSLVRRMEDILLLMDPTHSGFVTWESFSRVLLALAPQHLLRADVVSFVESQTKDIQNQVNYKEFIMSGKVLIVQKQIGKTELPVSGWLHRQKLFANDPSTYSWKAHVDWYRKRKSNCIIWLMRRAKRAFKQSDLYVEAKDWLLKKAVKAMAMTRLMEYGWAALHCEQIRIDAKKHLMIRVLNARQFKLKVDEALVYLRYWGTWALQNEALIVESNKKEEGSQLDYKIPIDFSKIEENRDIFRPTPKPPPGQDFSRVYIRYWARKNAQAWLADRGRLAMVHLNRRYDTLGWLIKYARRIVGQAVLQEETYNLLVARANRAIAYCSSQDDILKSLMRKGRTALVFMIKQEDSLEWTILRGKRGKRHQTRQEDLMAGLITKGRQTLWFLNRKEYAFKFLIDRVAIGKRLLAEKAKAIVFLQKIPNAIKKTQDRRDKCFDWLSWRGNKAKDHCLNQLKNLRQLQFYGGRAGKVKKRLQLAFVDLQQSAQYAKYKLFELKAQKTADMARKLREEIRRVKKKEKELAEVRKEKGRTSEEDKMIFCLQDAFYLLSKLYNKVANEEVIEIGSASVEIIKDEYNKSVLIGRQAFKRLFLTGAVLPTLDNKTLDHHFDSIDFKYTGFIHFDQFWTWYRHQLDEIKYNHQTEISQSKEFVTAAIINVMKPSKAPIPKYTIDNIFTIEERGLICVMRKFAEADARQNMEDNEQEDDDRFGSMKKKKIDDDSESESDEEEDEVPEGDDFGTDEFGRLMAKMRIYSKAGRK